VKDEGPLARVASALARVPRVPLASLPTPLHEAPRLRAALGGETRAPRILLKRDDLTGLALGGNKARKLEFLIADALARRATVVVTTGAVQSNHARMTAAAARAAGLEVALVLTAQTGTPALEGNLFLDRLFGARVHLVPASDDPRLALGDDAETVARVAGDVERAGGTPYVIPVGGSSGIGALGYVAGTLELCGQLADRGERPSRLYYASGSRGTQAGLVLGAALCEAPYEVLGIAVSGGEPEKIERARGAARDAADLLGLPAPLEPSDFTTEQDFIGEGYGIATPECLEAVALLAQTEGVLLDHVYTGKAMAGLIDHIRRGVLDREGSVVFLHTGGVPALFTRDAGLGFGEPLTEGQ
jgi:D-cysteine desulfhydrase family pyridoxal phosphate-dependent enzyme